MSEVDTLLTVQQACERLNVRMYTLRRMISDGTLRSTKLGPRLTRVYQSSVDEVLRNGVES